MGITLVSNAPAGNAAATAVANGTAGEAPAIDFAALLGLQLNAAATLTAASPTTPAQEPAEEAASATDQQLATPTAADPGLLPFLPAGLDPAALRPPPAKAEADADAPAVAMAGWQPLAPATSAAPAATDAGPALPAAAMDTPAWESAKIAAQAVADPRPEPAAATAEPPSLSPFAAALAAQKAVHEAPAVPPGPSTRMDTAVTDPAWGQDFGDRVVWLAKQDVQTAQLHLNPPQLGPVQITLNLSGDTATAAFVSPHAEVRQAISDALPQLREMLSAAGINLGQADVGSQSQQQQAENTPSGGKPRFSDDNAILHGNPAPGGSAAPVLTQRGRGLVDLFA